jgi:hypothetical protein
MSTVRARHLLWSGLVETEHREAPWPSAWGRSSSHYGTPNSDLVLSTRSRLREELVLQSYHSENGPREAGDGEVAQELYNNGGGDFWWCSSSKGCSGGGGAGRGSSSKHRISGRSWRGGLTARARQLWRLGFGSKFTQDRELFIGVLIPNRRRQKS